MYAMAAMATMEEMVAAADAYIASRSEVHLNACKTRAANMFDTNVDVCSPDGSVEFLEKHVRWLSKGSKSSMLDMYVGMYACCDEHTRDALAQLVVKYGGVVGSKKRKLSVPKRRGSSKVTVLS
jgi:hypothetical protein